MRTNSIIGRRGLYLARYSSSVLLLAVLLAIPTMGRGDEIPSSPSSSSSASADWWSAVSPGAMASLESTPSTDSFASVPLLTSPSKNPVVTVEQLDALLATKLRGFGAASRKRVAATLQRESVAAQLDPMLVFGLIDVESEFKGNAVSPSGARGLMQLIPSTAQRLAAQQGLRISTSQIYRDPGLQVQLGIRYLGSLKRRFGTVERALMAYNVGPERLQSLLDGGRSTRHLAGYARSVERKRSHYRKHLEKLAIQ